MQKGTSFKSIILFILLFFHYVIIYSTATLCQAVERKRQLRTGPYPEQLTVIFSSPGCILYSFPSNWKDGKPRKVQKKKQVDSHSLQYPGLPCSSNGKESTCNARDQGSLSGAERSSVEGKDKPLEYSFLENPMDRGAWQATACGVAKSWTQLSD